MTKLFFFVFFIFNIVYCNETNDAITLDDITIDEELPSSKQIANLTDILIKKLNNLGRSIGTLKLETIQFEPNVKFKEQQDYFYIDLKQIRYDSSSAVSVSQSGSSVILLKTGTVKRIDREYMCRAGNLCSCDDICRLVLNFTAQFRAVNDENQPISYNIQLPVVINDINDNKPFFYQQEIIIDLDMYTPIFGNDDGSLNKTNNLKIPLKTATDLDSTKVNRIQSYKLLKIETDMLDSAFLNYSTNELAIYLNFNDVVKKAYQRRFIARLVNETNYLTEKFQLKANDPDFEAFQDLLIKFKIEKIQINKSLIFNKEFYNFLSGNEFKIDLRPAGLIESITDCKFSQISFSLNDSADKFDLVYDKIDHHLLIKSVNRSRIIGPAYLDLTGTCIDSNGQIHYKDKAQVLIKPVGDQNNKLLNINIISALKELDIVNLNKTNLFQVQFRPNIAGSNPGSDESLITMAYLIVEQNKQANFKIGSGLKFKIDEEEFFDSNIQNKNKLFDISEMRNGLYSLRIKPSIYNKLKSSGTEEKLVNYKLRLIISFNNYKLNRYLVIKIPSSLVEEGGENLKQFSSTIETSTHTDNSYLTPNSGAHVASINLFNSVIIITTASVILSLFCMACFVVSASLYFTSKCRKGKDQMLEENKSTNLPNSNIFSSSSTSSSGFDSSNNSISSKKSSNTNQNKSLIIKSLETSGDMTTTTTTTTTGANGETNIMVYDMMPSGNSTGSKIYGQKSLNFNSKYQLGKSTEGLIKQSNSPIYTLSSSTSTCSNSNTNRSPNNISPVTTTTTSISNSHFMDIGMANQNNRNSTISNSPISNGGPLFDTHLDPSSLKDTNIIYDWFLQSSYQHKMDKACKENSIDMLDESPETNSAYGIDKPLQVDLQSKRKMKLKSILKEDNNIELSTSSDYSSSKASSSLFELPTSTSMKYRNEIYRNSHLIMKNFNQQGQQLNNYYSYMTPTPPPEDDPKMRDIHSLESNSKIYSAQPINVSDDDDKYLKFKPDSSTNLNENSYYNNEFQNSSSHNLDPNSTVNSRNERNSIRVKMLNRLSEAIAVANLSTNMNSHNNTNLTAILDTSDCANLQYSDGQISCV